MKRLLSGAAVLIMLAIGSMRAYSQSFDLNKLGENVITAVQAKKTDWKYEAVSPIQGSEAVVLQQWTLGSQSIRIAIIPHKSPADASRLLVDLVTNGGGRKDTEDLGDEAVSWGKNSFSFRRRNITVDISAVNTNPTVDVTESSNRRADERKLCKEFARIVADAIKDTN